jgi:predicted RNA-binding protein (virulence factor B family)
MTNLGRFNDLMISSLTAHGALLADGSGGELLLPAREVPPGAEPGETLRVFVYNGPEEQRVATTAVPAAQVGEVAYLKIVQVNDAGAFLNWGLPKDLLLPWNEVKREQKKLIVEGRKVVVAVFLAEDGRIAASSRLDDFLKEETDRFQEGDKVEVMVADRTDLGLRVIVNHRFYGLVHNNEIFGTLHRGQKLEGYVKALRPDHKLNITLSAPGYAKVGTFSEGLLAVLARRGGFLPVSDKTPPEEIYALFGVSKKVFKQTLGALYKSGRITIEATGIRAVQTN